jgi:O-antigen ligase
MTILSLLIIMIASLAPLDLVLALGIPVLIVLAEGMLLLPPLLTVGSADIEIYDVIIAVCALKAAARVAKPELRKQLPHVPGPVLLFPAVLTAATLAAARFGPEYLPAQSTALVRFMAQYAILLLLIAATSARATLRFPRAIDALGYLILISLLVNVILSGFGIQIGEVQVSETGIRIFGPIGDSVGFILTFFVILAIVQGRLVLASINAAAIVLTGTRGALLVLVVAFVVLMLRGSRLHWRVGSRLVPVVICAAGLFVTLMVTDVGGMRQRLSTEDVAYRAFERGTTASTAAAVFADQPFIGVGFTGFRLHANDYGIWEAFTRQRDYHENYAATTGNQYLQILTDAGLVGLFAFLALMAVLLRQFRALSRHPLPGMAAIGIAAYVWLVALLVGNQTASWILPSSLVACVLWIIAAPSIAARAPRPVVEDDAEPLPTSVLAEVARA